jgi:hypothetical protein
MYERISHRSNPPNTDLEEDSDPHNACRYGVMEYMQEELKCQKLSRTGITCEFSGGMRDFPFKTKTTESTNSTNLLR